MRIEEDKSRGSHPKNHEMCTNIVLTGANDKTSLPKTYKHKRELEI